MTEYRLKISGVHYGANGDFVAGQKDTEEMHVRTRELLSWIDNERPIVVLAPDPANHIHSDAIMARARGRRIGRVAMECVELAWALLRQSGQSMIMARVSKVAVKEHGYIVVTVDGDELEAAQPPLKTAEIEWRRWMSDLPLMPPSERLQSELEAAYVLDNVFMPHLAETNIDELKEYLDIWLEGSRHDLSREARQKWLTYIECLETAQDKNIRLLAEALKDQRARICERAPLDEHATTWWNERMESSDVQQLWHQWRLKNENKLWLGLRRIDSLLRELPGELYGDIGKLDVVLSRLYYMNTPRQAFMAILALMMLRELTCRELGIEMRPMAEDDYQQDGMITNPMDMPTTIGRVMAFGETLHDTNQKQTVEMLAHWLRDDYEKRQPLRLMTVVEDGRVRLAKAIEKVANKPTTQINTLELVQKKETNIDKNYGPNIENNGTLSLPDKDMAQ